MKKLTMICMSALLMLAVSCKKDKKDEIENAGSGFRATVESHEGTGKTHLESDLSIKWDSGDAILVKSSTCTTPRGFTTQGSGATVNFDADATLPTNFYAPPYTGYYPASAFEGDQLTLPATQTYVAGSFGNGANPMAATSSETLLPFKNVCGVLKLQLYSTTACQVRSISITSNTGQMLWGTGAVGFDAADDNDNPTLGTLSDGGSTLTLDMGSTGEPMSISESAPTAYYFVVPVGTLGTSFTVKVTDTDGKVWTKTANSSANRIVRSQITKMPELPVTAHEYVDLGLPSGLLWATCNLGGDPSDLDAAADWYGWYFMWGSVTEGGDPDCSWAKCPGNGGSSSYNSSAIATWNSSYLTDNVLKSGVDAAAAAWGDGWRMPTKGEWQDLYDNTTNAWTNNYNSTGVAGRVFTSKIDSSKSIFLPAAGRRDGTSLHDAGSIGYYWSSSLYTDFPIVAYCMYFNSGNVTPQFNSGRYYGFSVRPVR